MNEIFCLQFFKALKDARKYNRTSRKIILNSRKKTKEILNKAWRLNKKKVEKVGGESEGEETKRDRKLRSPEKRWEREKERRGGTSLLTTSRPSFVSSVVNRGRWNWWRGERNLADEQKLIPSYFAFECR